MNLNYLKDKHKHSLLEMLQKYEELFDGTLGNAWQTKPIYDIYIYI